MRLVITGVDDDQRSCVVEERVVEPRTIGSLDGVALAMLYVTEQSPPPSRAAAQSGSMDARLAPGWTRWMLIDRTANSVTEMHHTDTLDYVFVLSGSTELMLQKSTCTLERGDCVVVAGVDHAWRTGPLGCQLLSVLVGTPPPRPPG